jgi:hypothetical protein
MIACAINERMQRKLDYTQEEVRVLKEILAALTGSRRISFIADQRSRLAIAGKALSPEERKKHLLPGPRVHEPAARYHAAATGPGPN